MRRFIVFVGLAILSLTAAPLAQLAAPQAPATIPPELALTRTLPIDPAVRAGRLPNGLRYFIRQNARPANRVSMRLAVNAGAVQEDPDQRGLAHFLEHMAFNGTEHFKPGELVSFLESIGARFGPHVNASTSFDETIYMLDIPTDRPGYVDRGQLLSRRRICWILQRWWIHAHQCFGHSDPSPPSRSSACWAPYTVRRTLPVAGFCGPGLMSSSGTGGGTRRRR